MSLQLGLEYVDRRYLSDVFREPVPHISCGKRESLVTVGISVCARNFSDDTLTNVSRF